MTATARLNEADYPIASTCPELEHLTPIMFAAKYGCIDYIEENLSSLKKSVKKSILDLVNIGGFTALHFAARNGQIEAVKSLLKHGASPFIQSVLHQLPLHVLFSQDNDNKSALAIFQLLAPFKETFQAIDTNGDTIAHLAARVGWHDILQTILSIDKEMLKSRNQQGMTPLLVAILANQLETSRYLLSCEAKTMTDFKGRNALHYAALYGDESLLLEAMPHFPIDGVDREKNTALQLALTIKNKENSLLLMKAGASIEKVSLNLEWLKHQSSFGP